MSAAAQSGLDRTFGAPRLVGSVYDRNTRIDGNFDIWSDGYAKTQYDGAVKPLSDDPSEWAAEAGLEWNLSEAPCYYELGTGTEDELMYPFKDRKVLYRSDTNLPLAIVSSRYKPVQPTDILRMFGDMVSKYGFELKLAGEALNGRRIFAMAKCPQSLVMPGNDRIDNYLMLVTHNDGTGATRCFFSSVRLWCMNQLPLIINSRSGVGVRGTVARQTHSSDFDASHMQQRLKSINKDWAEFERVLHGMLNAYVTEEQALVYFGRTFGRIDDEDAIDYKALAEDRSLQRVLMTYNHGVGQDRSIGTVYGALNAVTRYLDHDKGARSPASAVENNWLGTGRKIKEKAFVLACELIE